MDLLDCASSLDARSCIQMYCVTTCCAGFASAASRAYRSPRRRFRYTGGPTPGSWYYSKCVRYSGVCHAAAPVQQHQINSVRSEGGTRPRQTRREICTAIVYILQYSIRSWSFQGVCGDAGWPRFLATCSVGFTERGTVATFYRCGG